MSDEASVQCDGCLELGLETVGGMGGTEMEKGHSGTLKAWSPKQGPPCPI